MTKDAPYPEIFNGIPLSEVDNMVKCAETGEPRIFVWGSSDTAAHFWADMHAKGFAESRIEAAGLSLKLTGAGQSYVRNNLMDRYWHIRQYLLEKEKKLNIGVKERPSDKIVVAEEKPRVPPKFSIEVKGGEGEDRYHVWTRIPGPIPRSRRSCNMSRQEMLNYIGLGSVVQAWKASSKRPTVTIRLSGQHITEGGSKYRSLLVDSFGKDQDFWAELGRKNNYGRFPVRVTAEDFGRFLVLRNDMGFANGFKELYPVLDGDARFDKTVIDLTERK